MLVATRNYTMIISCGSNDWLGDKNTLWAKVPYLFHYFPH